MTEKTATVHWEGAGKQGKGQISTETGAMKQVPYGFASRFEDDQRGSNPEELLAAAHAACFTMAFSFACDKAGLATSRVDTEARVRLTGPGRQLRHRPHQPDDDRGGAGPGRGAVPGHRPGRQARLSAVQGAGRGGRDQPAGHAGTSGGLRLARRWPAAHNGGTPTACPSRRHGHRHPHRAQPARDPRRRDGVCARRRLADLAELVAQPSLLGDEAPAQALMAQPLCRARPARGRVQHRRSQAQAAPGLVTVHRVLTTAGPM